MNVFGVSVGRSAKPLTASCAARKALVVFMVRSRLKSDSARVKGEVGGVRVEALAVFIVNVVHGGIMWFCVVVVVAMGEMGTYRYTRLHSVDVQMFRAPFRRYELHHLVWRSRSL